MLVERRVEWVERRVVRVVVRWVCAVCISLGRVTIAEVLRVRDVLWRDEIGGGETGEAMRQR